MIKQICQTMGQLWTITGDPLTYYFLIDILAIVWQKGCMIKNVSDNVVPNAINRGISWRILFVNIYPKVQWNQIWDLVLVFSLGTLFTKISIERSLLKTSYFITVKNKFHKKKIKVHNISSNSKSINLSSTFQ